MLGDTIYTSENTCIHENGLSYKGFVKEGSMLWRDIEKVFICGENGTHVINIPIPTHESINLRIVNYANEAIRLGGNSKDKINNLYTYIVEKIFNRQWAAFWSAIKAGKRISFESFDVTSEAVYRKRFFGGYDIIELHRLTGCDFEDGELVIEYVNDYGKIIHKKSGHLSEIPNIHIAHTFLMMYAKQSLESISKN